MKKQRANLSQKAVLEYSNAIWDKIYNMPLYKNAAVIFLYSSIGNEVQTAAFARAALKDGKKVAYPVTDMTDNTMEFHTVDDLSQLGPVKSGSMSLTEPKPDPKTKITPDEHTLMIVPGLAFDENLYRTGYGGGFYDKYIGQYPGLMTIGVCYEFQRVDRIGVNKYDVAVRGLIVP